MNEGKEIKFNLIRGEITDLTETATHTKGEMRPFYGWPGGIDPYPDKTDDEIVLTARFDEKYKMEATGIVSGEIKVLDWFAHDGRKWLITAFHMAMPARTVKIVAMNYPEICPTTTK